MSLRRRLLAPASGIYRLATAVDRRWKSSRRFESKLPVISVGNISSGGSGKSQLVGTLIRSLQPRYPILLLSRGYGRKDSVARVWRAGDPSPDPALFGDEPAMLAGEIARGALAVASNRAALLASIESEFPGAIVLLDDGFQHHRLARDLDIVIVDESTATDRGLIPLGRLREPGPALARAGVVMVDGDAADQFARDYAPDVPRFRFGIQPSGITRSDGADRLPQRPILVTGIARPERVRRSLEELGIDPIGEMRFGDHQVYSAPIVRTILQRMRELGAGSIITTAKDAVKLRAVAEVRDLLYVLEVELVVDRLDDLLQIIEKIVRQERDI